MIRKSARCPKAQLNWRQVWKLKAIVNVFLPIIALSPEVSEAQQLRYSVSWPFASTSPWNMPIGSGANYSAQSANITTTLRSGTITYNAGLYSLPVFVSQASDPILMETGNNNGNVLTFNINVPAVARPDPSVDAELIILNPTHDSSLESYGTIVKNDGSISAIDSVQYDLRGSGWAGPGLNPWVPLLRAAGASGMGGLLRVGEVQALSIPHALAFSISTDKAKHGPVWPAYNEDYCAWMYLPSSTCYTGSVPMGTLFSIPPSVNVTQIGLNTPLGVAIAHALQDYGAYVVDTGGINQMALYAENAAAGMPQFKGLYDDLRIMQRYFAAIQNNTPTTMGGGGIRRQPLAPNFAVPLPATCGSANGRHLTSPPAGGVPLCTVGATPPGLTLISGKGPWTWVCVSGSTSAYCSTL